MLPAAPQLEQVAGLSRKVASRLGQGRRTVRGVNDLRAWLNETDRLRAERVVELDSGFAVLDDTFANAHSLNKLVVTRRTSATQVAADADLALDHLPHRLVDVLDPELVPGAPPGWTRHDGLLMTTNGPGVGSSAVLALTLQERQEVATADWQRDEPHQHPDVWRQLGQRVQTVTRAATPTFLAVRRVDGRVVARADLYLRDGVAQVEEVLTDPGHRGRGHASALVRHAVHAARRQGAQTVFLLADADDWPRQLYGRLGFVDGGRTAQLTRSA